MLGLVYRLLAVCDVSLEICLLRLFTSRKSSSWAVDATEVLFTASLCPAFAVTLRPASVHFVLPCTCRKALKGGFPLRFLQKFALFFSALFTIEVHSELSPTLAGDHPARISVSFSSMFLFYYSTCFWVKYNFACGSVWVRNLVSITLREEHRLRMIQNRVLRRIFGPKRE
jgi:hypothetical protein